MRSIYTRVVKEARAASYVLDLNTNALGEEVEGKVVNL
jgi:hypothetical protein